MKLFYVLLLVCCSGHVTAQQQVIDTKQNILDNTLLWEVSGNGLTAPSYLYGTFHLLCTDDIRFGNGVKTAVAASQSVYLELDLDDPATLMSGMMLMSMKGGKKLKDLYTPEAYARIVAFFKDSLKTNLALFQGIKPEFLVAFLYPKMMPCTSTGSVEEGIMQLAKAGNKAIYGLETMAFQASLFDSIPYEKQAASLLEAIDSLDKSKKYFNLMLAAYRNQRLDEIEKIVNDKEFGVEDNQDELLDKRNKNWVVQLKKIMKAEPVFVAVGAGHLVGNAGLIALLRAEGYTVKGLQNKE